MNNITLYVRMEDITGTSCQREKKQQQQCKGSRQLAGIFYLTESNCKAWGSKYRITLSPKSTT